LHRQDSAGRERRHPPQAVQGRLRSHGAQAVHQALYDQKSPDDRRVAESGTLMATLWSGRFDAAPNAAAFEFGSSFRFDRRLFEDDVTGSAAWARALLKAGVLSAEDAQAIDAALADILARGRADASFVAGPDEDVHSFVE